MKRAKSDNRANEALLAFQAFLDLQGPKVLRAMSVPRATADLMASDTKDRWGNPASKVLQARLEWALPAELVNAAGLAQEVFRCNIEIDQS